MVEIGRTRRLKRVSWAPGVSLCQVRLFLSEDAPCQLGLSPQDHLQAKDSWASAGSTSDDSPLPPGFETVHNQNCPKTDISKIPVICWKCPPKIVLNSEWFLVAGEESQEIAKQNQRNFAVLEAIYPRQSTIPPNPSIAAEALESCPDDSTISLVPLTAIEELEDKDPSDPFDSQQVHSERSLVVSHQSNSASHPTVAPPGQVPPVNVSVSPPLSDMSVLFSRLGAHADVAAATAAAITAVTSAEQGNLIDQDLLIKILSDPSLVGLVLPEHQKPIPQPTTSSMAMSAPLPVPPLPSQHSSNLFNRNMNDPNPGVTRPVVPTTAPGPLPPLPPSHHHNVLLFNTTRNPNTNPRPPQSMVTSTLSTPIPPPPPPPPQAHILPPFSSVRPSMTSPVATPPPLPSQPQILPTTIRPLPSATPGKDPNYYKSLIKQHGGENLGSTNPDVAGTGAGTMQIKGQQNGVSDGTNPKVKTCAFFNTARGCKHGDSCFFIHDSSINLRNDRAKKRVKR